MPYQLSATQNNFPEDVPSASPSIRSLLQAGVSYVEPMYQDFQRTVQPVLQGQAQPRSVTQTPQQSAQVGQPLEQKQSAMQPLQFSEVGGSQPTGKTIQIGGRNYPANSVTAQQIPMMTPVPGVSPEAGVYASDAGGDDADVVPQEEPLPPYVPLASDDPLLAPSFSSGAQASPMMLPMMPGSFGQAGSSAAPVQTGGAQGFQYPLGTGQQLPPSAIQGEMDSLPVPETMTPEMKDELQNLLKARAHYGKILNQPSPYEAAKEYYAKRSGSLLGKIGQVGAMAFGDPNNRVQRGGVPLNLQQYLGTAGFKNQQAIYDDAQDKYIQLTNKIAEIRQAHAFKKADLQDKEAQRKNVTPATKLAAMQGLMQMPTFQINPATGAPMVGPDGKPVLDQNKLQAIDVYIAAGLVDPHMRNAIMFTYPQGAALAIKKEALAVAHAEVSNKIANETAKLRLEKLQKTLDLDIESKKLLKRLREQELSLNELRRRQVDVQIQNTLADNIRADKAAVRQMMMDKETLDMRLNQDKLSWTRIAGLNPKFSAVHGFTPEAIAQAQQNVKMINLYQSGQMQFLMAAFEEVTGKSGSLPALTGFMQTAPDAQKMKVAERAQQLETESKNPKPASAEVPTQTPRQVAARK